MDDLTLRYFDAEMRYLRDAAKEFAETHPDRAAMLDLDKAGPPDPYVERLLEGFAFSTGRLREKIDDDLPELTEGLVSMLWPHYLRTIPSLSVVALTPDLAAMKMAENIPKGLEIASRPVGPKNTVCRYRTTRDLTLNPLAVSGVVMTTEPDGRSALRIRFACSEQASWRQTDLRRLPLYLGEDAVTGSALHLMLTRARRRYTFDCLTSQSGCDSTATFRPADLATMTPVARGRQRVQRLATAAGIFRLS